MRLNKSFALRFSALFSLPILLLLNAALAGQGVVTEDVTTVAGTGERDGPLGDGGQARAATLMSPESVYVDRAGNVFIGDSGQHRVRKVTPGGVITTFAGNGFDAPPPAPDLRATEAGILWPSGIVANGSGNMFIVEKISGAIYKIPPDGSKIELFAGPSATSRPFRDPEKIFIAPDGNLYVAGGQANRINKVSPDGETAVVAGSGRQETSGDGGLAVNAGVYFPKDVLMDKEGSIYFTNFPGLIRKIDTHGIITTFAGGGQTVPCDSIPATDCSLNGPEALEIDKNGNIYIASFRKILKVSPNGIITTLNSSAQAGSGSCMGYSGEGGPLADANFCDIKDLFIDAAENLYIVDTGYHRVVKVNVRDEISRAPLEAGSETAPQNTNSGQDGASNSASSNSGTTESTIGGCGWDRR